MIQIGPSMTDVIASLANSAALPIAFVSAVVLVLVLTIWIWLKSWVTNEHSKRKA